jgi:hypothetical protein
MPHQHSPTSNWQSKHRLYQVAREEMRRVYDNAFRDPEIAETVALKESVLLDVDQGEVLRTPVYTRTFDVLNRR